MAFKVLESYDLAKRGEKTLRLTYEETTKGNHYYHIAAWVTDTYYLSEDKGRDLYFSEDEMETVYKLLEDRDIKPKAKVNKADAIKIKTSKDELTEKIKSACSSNNIQVNRGKFPFAPQLGEMYTAYAIGQKKTQKLTQMVNSLGLSMFETQKGVFIYGSEK